MCNVGFSVNDKVKFRPSPFLFRTIGHLSSVRLAIEKEKVFTVSETSDYLGDQFIEVKGNQEEHFGLLNAHLFKKA